MIPLLLAMAAMAAPLSPPVERAEPLRAADLAFARAVATGDRAAFADLVDPDAVFAGGARLREGRAAVVEAWSVFFAEGGPRLAWAPDEAVLSASGDLGYTIGSSRLESTGEDGKRTVREGRYLTVWRRGPDGRWRALFDLSYEPDAARTAGPGRTPVRRAAAAAGDLAAEMGTWSRAHGGGGPAAGAYLVIERRGAAGEALDGPATATTFRAPPPAPGAAQ